MNIACEIVNSALFLKRAKTFAPIIRSMSIVTKTGDAGMTGLMYNRRVSKTAVLRSSSSPTTKADTTLGISATAGIWTTNRSLTPFRRYRSVVPICRSRGN